MRSLIKGSRPGPAKQSIITVPSEPLSLIVEGIGAQKPSDSEPALPKQKKLSQALLQKVSRSTNTLQEHTTLQEHHSFEDTRIVDTYKYALQLTPLP